MKSNLKHSPFFVMFRSIARTIFFLDRKEYTLYLNTFARQQVAIQHGRNSSKLGKRFKFQMDNISNATFFYEFNVITFMLDFLINHFGNKNIFYKNSMV